VRIQLQHAYILHRRVYRDTSLIVELLSRDLGRISAVARGARRSRNNALLQPFQPMLCSWFGRGELYTLGNVEAADVYQKINGQYVLSGLYLNELLMRLLPKEEAVDTLYDYYAEAVSGLAQLSVVNSTECESPDFREQKILRRFEKGLLEQLGYGLDFSLESETNKRVCLANRYAFIPSKGLIKTSDSSAISGASLLALASDQLNSEQSLREAKRLLRTILDQYLGNRPLHSRELRHKYARQKTPKK